MEQISSKWETLETQRKLIQELGILCVQNGITKFDLFNLINEKKRESTD